MSEFLGIDINLLNYGGFQFWQTELIHKFSEATGMEHCNRLPITTKVEASLGTDTNSSRDKNIAPSRMLLL